MAKTIRDPATYAIATLGDIFGIVPRMLRRVAGETEAPQVRAITLDDIGAALAAGLDDIRAFRSDAIFVCFLYPIVGLLLAAVAFQRELLPLIFPLIAGFTLLGPIAGIGLYEMSRRRAAGLEASWADLFKLFSSPSLGPIILLGLILFGLFLIWMGAAALIYQATLAPLHPAGPVDFVVKGLTTAQGWAMGVVGFAVGAVFAAVALSISFVGLPLLVDRDVGLVPAIVTSIRAAAKSPGPVAVWGLLISAALAMAAVPALLGLVVVFPILGHATWHLYRRAVVAPADETPKPRD